jgi:hypothetical protein
MSPQPGRQPDVYELTIIGSIGPMLRSALAPCQATSPHESTLLRAWSGELDLVDLVTRLHAQGLEVEDAFETVATSSTVHDVATRAAAERGGAPSVDPGGQT